MTKAYLGYRIDGEIGRFRWCVTIWHSDDEIEHVFVSGPVAAKKLAMQRNLNLRNMW